MSIARGTAVALLPLLVASTVPGYGQEPSTKTETAPLAGYSTAASATERDWEAKFRALPSPDNLREYMRHLTAHPHHVGSPYDKENAEWILAQFKSWGLDAEIETFYVLFPTPKDRELELVAPTTFKAKLQEPPVPEDPTSNQQAEQLPTYNAYSIDGDVTAPLVYVNQGVREDYERLDRMGVSVKGAIVIARYGGAWRGIKPKVAAEHGAVGCIIYSDPRDDGYAPGDVFPKGAFRPEEGVQRGGVNDTFYSGDPLTPGYAATKDAKRLPIKDNPEITKIPVMPISYGDAQPLLAAIGGQTRATGMARQPADYLPCRPGAGEGASEGLIELGHQAGLRRDRADPRLGVSRPVGHSRQSPRRLGEWRRRPHLRPGRADGRGALDGGVGEAGMEAEAHDHLLRVGRRRARTARLDGVGRDASGRAAQESGDVCELRQQRARLFGQLMARTLWSTSSTASNATFPIRKPS